MTPLESSYLPELCPALDRSGPDCNLPSKEVVETLEAQGCSKLSMPLQNSKRHRQVKQGSRGLSTCGAKTGVSCLLICACLRTQETGLSHLRRVQV